MSPLDSNRAPLVDHDLLQRHGQVQSNPPIAPQTPQPQIIYYQSPSTGLSAGAVYALWLPPLGILGIHRAALGHTGWCVAYFFTCGFFILGWLLDAFRIPVMIERQKKDPQHLKYYSDDVYLVWFIFGLIGGHHLYLRRYPWFFAYFFTLGLFGIGWLVDIFLIPRYVRNKNKNVVPPFLPSYDPAQPPLPPPVHIHIHGQDSVAPNYGTYQPPQFMPNPAQYPFPVGDADQAPPTSSQNPSNELPPAYAEIGDK